MSFEHQHQTIDRVKHARNAADRIALVSTFALVVGLIVEWIVPNDTMPRMLLGILVAVSAVAWVCFTLAWCTVQILRAMHANDVAADRSARANAYAELIDIGNDHIHDRHLRSVRE